MKNEELELYRKIMSLVQANRNLTAAKINEEKRKIKLEQRKQKKTGATSERTNFFR